MYCSANLPPFTQQEEAPEKFVISTCHMYVVWKPHVPVRLISVHVKCDVVIGHVMLLVNLNWSIHIGSCTVCVCVSHLFTHIFAKAVTFFFFPPHTGTRLQIAAFVWCYKLLSLLLYKLCWSVLLSRTFLGFFPYKVKTVLFVSSGPKPCEACRQEEIYEEPISILNSNEVSHEVFDFNWLTPITSWEIVITTHVVWQKIFWLGFPVITNSHIANISCLSAIKITGLSHTKNNSSLLTGISRQCCRSRNSKSPCQVFEPGLWLDRLDKTIWGGV